MPQLNGIDVLNKINSMQLKKKPLFIMLSALGNDKTTQQALDLGAECYIVKPFDMDILVNKIYQVHSSNQHVI